MKFKLLAYQVPNKNFEVDSSQEVKFWQWNVLRVDHFTLCRCQCSDVKN